MIEFFFLMAVLKSLNDVIVLILSEREFHIFAA